MYHRSRTQAKKSGVNPSSPIQCAHAKGGRRFVFANPNKTGKDWLKDRVAPAPTEGLKPSDRKAGPREIGRVEGGWTPAQYEEHQKRQTANPSKQRLSKRFTIADVTIDGKDWLKDRLPSV